MKSWPGISCYLMADRIHLIEPISAVIHIHETLKDVFDFSFSGT